jgi:pimeloyl-ACP methyl ester carboxylesterase
MDHVPVARRVPPTRYAQSAGAKIAFQVSGEGPCDLPGDPFHKRGTGLSDPTGALPDMDQRVVDLAAVMDAAGSRGPRPALLRRYRSIVGHWGQGHLLELVGPSLAGPAGREAAGALERAAASPGMAAALIESMGRADVSDLLATLQTPTLVVHREQDMIPLADAREVADAIPGAVLRVVPAAITCPGPATGSRSCRRSPASSTMSRGP